MADNTPTLDLLGGITPPPSSGVGAEQPIGVPPTYDPSSHQQLGRPGTTDIPYARIGNTPAALNTIKGKQALYSDSDVYEMAGQPYAKVKAVQDQMVAAGLLDPHSFTPGVWDVDSAKAFTSVLAVANGYGAVWKDTLDALVSQAPDPAATRQGQISATTNPIDIRAAVSTPNGANVAQQLIGENLPAGETHNFSAWYQDQEAQARDRYNKVDLTKGGTYTAAPGIDAAAQEYIKQHNLGQVIAYGTASRMLEFQQMLGAL